MLKNFFLFFIFPFFFFDPFLVFAAGADLRMDPSDIRFSKSPLIAGDTVRIYSKVKNVGTVDISGYVSFYQGSGVIKEPQVISVVAGGDPEEVFVDFVVPDSSFNIRTVISGTTPQDVNVDNNVSITGMMTPLQDTDKDGIPNGTDNCPELANQKQENVDQDKLGDVCDDDSDNDSLTNAVEAEIGTNPFIKDTDQDGVSDASDAYPLDKNRSVLQKNVPIIEEKIVETKKEPIPEIKQIENSEPSPKIISQLKETVASVVNSAKEIAETKKENSPITSANAVFTYEKNSWNTYTFRLIAPQNDRVVYDWNFGDGVRSGKASVAHTFATSGTFHVTLKITDDQHQVSEESTDVRVSFFDVHNPIIITTLFLLGLTLLFSMMLFLRGVIQKKKPQTSIVSTEKHIHVQEE